MSCWCRWSQFRQSIEAIETHLKSLHAGEPVSYKQPIGGGYYISITSGFYCIDIRKWFMPYGETDIKPTRQGVALRLREWATMKNIMEAINERYPSLGTALPCYLADDHCNQIGALQCRECNPFTAITYWAELYWWRISMNWTALWRKTWCVFTITDLVCVCVK